MDFLKMNFVALIFWILLIRYNKIAHAVDDPVLLEYSDYYYDLYYGDYNYDGNFGKYHH